MELNIDSIKFQKMVFLYNAINAGWTIKKKNDSYVFRKKHGEKKEVFLDTYLTRFINEQLDMDKLLA